MSKLDTDISGLNEYIKKLEQSTDKLIETVKKQAMQDAEVLAGKQRANCPVVTGELRESIQSYCVLQGDIIEAGTRTNCEHAVYVEFGTGPVGSKNGHPLDSELGVVRKADSWKVNIPGVGYRYTEGQPANPFMYRGIKEMEETIKEHFGSAVKEVMK